MPPFDTTLAFFAASLVLAIVPGPDNVFVLLHAASHGQRAGLLAVLGLCSGLLVHTAAVALGLAAVLAASPRAFTALTVLGAAYLLWLAWQSWRAPVGTLAPPFLRSIRAQRVLNRVASAVFIALALRLAWG